MENLNEKNEPSQLFSVVLVPLYKTRNRELMPIYIIYNLNIDRIEQNLVYKYQNGAKMRTSTTDLFDLLKVVVLKTCCKLSIAY